MTLLRLCDVCEDKIEDTEEFVYVTLPGSFTGDAGGEQMGLDVCSAECVANLGTQLLAISENGVEKAPEDDLIPQTQGVPAVPHSLVADVEMRS